jgi:Tfp pilus assembly protein PilO
MRGLIPIICILIAGAVFYWYIDPTYTAIKELRTQEGTLDLALNRSLELQQARDQLLSRYNTFSPNDLTRLEKLLPDHVDNVRLILDLDGIATRYGMRVRNVSIDAPKASSATTIGPDELPYESLVLSFTVSGQYNTFRQFMNDLEHSLRLVDVVGIHFSSNDNGVYDFTISVKTYWLKP